MLQPEAAAAMLAAALNDTRRSRIGDPRRGHYPVSFIAKTRAEANDIKQALSALGIKARINGNPDPEKAKVAYVAIYDNDDIQRLYEALGPELNEPRRTRLHDLVRARGPIPMDTILKMEATIAAGKSYDYVADRLNELDLIDGVRGGGWTSKKAWLTLEDYWRSKRR